MRRFSMNARRFLILFFMLFIVLLGACSRTGVQSINNLAADLPKSTPAMESNSQEGEAKIINNEGWQIPMPEKKRRIRISVTKGSTNEGSSVKETIADY